ncbi:hypothetical protein C8A01DRAFT_44408 [Parachaetomium inaequale]|uniref:Uncharacterized protein n=1 Tax=Parachaetomium inaequale TaxID=2588326 RepID=A0AAN6PMA7_9PEZI|nr:hypothetical protein C8A01DRAFT_44408 [Parachaetomium inaequale]
MDKPGFGCLWVLLALLAWRASAACTSYGVDYSSGGAYYIDGESSEYFSFVSVFQGCSPETISPVLVGPNDNAYACSDIKTDPAGTQVTSTCGIPFSAMVSGRWRIIIAGDQISSQRTISLTVGVPQTTRVTVSDDSAAVLTTLVLTETLIIVPRTVTARYQQGPTALVTSTAIRTVTDGQVTSYWTTTVSATASCHYPLSWSSLLTPDRSPSPAVTWCQNADPTATEERDAAAAAAVAAVTVTYTQTTYTVTSTVVTTVPARTTTELVVKTTTATVTPNPSTVCAGGSPDVTITVNRGNPTPVTRTDIIYLTSHLSGTVWVGQTYLTTSTNSASATACWRAGGWFG